jgi:hypothetical protein
MKIDEDHINEIIRYIENVIDNKLWIFSNCKCPRIEGKDEAIREIKYYLINKEL